MSRIATSGEIPAATLPCAGGGHIAYRRREGGGPELLFLGGFRSNMTGTKAAALDGFAAATERAYTRFDYRGHGASSGKFEDLTVGDWIADALAVLDQATQGPLILIGSSMGAWIAIHAALARPERVAGLLTIAAAPDFTEDLIWARLTETHADLRPLLGRLTDGISQMSTGLDDATRAHIRNLDVYMARLIEEMISGREEMVRQIRSDIKLLARTIAAVGEEANRA